MDTKINDSQNNSVSNLDKNETNEGYISLKGKKVIKVSRNNRSFSERMAEAGYVPGRRYDIIKNLFLSYKTKERRPKSVNCKISKSGEVFYLGRKNFAKICIVGGYLRIYLALDPKNYNVDKYHHRDYSDVSKYQKYPMMLKLSSDRQVKYAEELIKEILESNNFELDENYVYKDQANIFKKIYRKKSKTNDLSSINSLKTEENEEDVEDENDEENEDNSNQKTTSQISFEKVLNVENIDIKIPRHAKIVNKKGEEVGKLDDDVWYDLNENENGYFKKEETNVFYYYNNTKKGYVDKNHNILSLSNEYIATIKINKNIWLYILLILLIVATLFSSLWAAYNVFYSNSNSVPTIFVTSENGEEWSTNKKLPIFYNDVFGDEVVIPGMKGKYRFRFENKNENRIQYSLQFSEQNEYNIEMVYRLKKDNVYIAEKENYIDVNKLNVTDLTIESKSSTILELEWFWKDNDDIDTIAGNNKAMYSLTISFSAYVVE